MLSHRDFVTKGSQCVTWNYCIYIPHFPTCIVDFKQVNTGWVKSNWTKYNTARCLCPIH